MKDTQLTCCLQKQNCTFLISASKLERAISLQQHANCVYLAMLLKNFYVIQFSNKAVALLHISLEFILTMTLKNFSYFSSIRQQYCSAYAHCNQAYFSHDAESLIRIAISCKQNVLMRNYFNIIHLC